MAEGRYREWAVGLTGDVCEDCGAVVVDKATHDRFHSILSSHGWALAVLKTAHLAEHVHDRWEVPQKIDSKKFDNWSADALAEVVGQRDQSAGSR